MLRKIKQALAPDRNKWFDLNDVKVIGGAVLAFITGWALVSLTIIIL